MSKMNSKWWLFTMHNILTIPFNFNTPLKLFNPHKHVNLPLTTKHIIKSVVSKLKNFTSTIIFQVRYYIYLRICRAYQVTPLYNMARISLYIPKMDGIFLLKVNKRTFIQAPWFKTGLAYKLTSNNKIECSIITDDYVLSWYNITFTFIFQL
jgi:hypothetical protein